MKLDSPIVRAAALAIVALLVVPAVAGAQGVMFIKNNRVGVGISTPQFLFHARSTVAGDKIISRLDNNGAAFQAFFDSSSSITWGLHPLKTGGISSNSFTITRYGTGVPELLLGPTGNMTITGTLTQNSSRAFKENFVELDSREVLARVADLEVLEWSYKNQGVRHFGPMAEDFHAAFGLGANNKGIAPGDLAGVSLAAVQGLRREIADRDGEIERLEREMAELRAMVEALVAN